MDVVRDARVRGQLDLREPWLPEPVRLWPFGLYLPGQRMELPPPGGTG